jgi:lysyl-tRNA synthetase class 2
MNQRPWWRPDEFAARKPNLEARMAVIAAIRRFFAERDFAEVETPALQVSPGIEPHLIAFETELAEPFQDGARRNLYLHTSPEFAMKKLLVAGQPRIYQLARCYRNGERSATHHPEFTMLEWYRTGADYRALMDDCEELLRAVMAAVPAAALVRGEKRSDPGAEWEYLTVAEAFRRDAGIDVLATAPDPLAPDAGLLRAETDRIGVYSSPSDSWEDIFFRVFLARIEGGLGVDAPTVLYDYPVSMAALSRAKPDDPRLAERFELYVSGLELANAFSELTDAAEQRRRFETDVARKRELFGSAYPIDEDFLAALDHGLADCAGIALGVDRLVMLATGAPRIEDVLWAPVAAT